MGDTPQSVHAVGSKVWVQDATEAWLKADVIALDGEYVKVRTELGDERREKGLDCPRQNLETRPEEVPNFKHSLLIRPLGHDEATLSQRTCSSMEFESTI